MESPGRTHRQSSTLPAERPSILAKFHPFHGTEEQSHRYNSTENNLIVCTEEGFLTQFPVSESSRIADVHGWLPPIFSYLHRIILHLCICVGSQGLYNILYLVHCLHYSHHRHCFHHNSIDLFPTSGGRPRVVVEISSLRRINR